MGIALFALLFWSQALGSIDGVVLRAGTSEPVRNATVVLSLGTAQAATTADDAGRFKFINLPPGSYRLNARRDGYLGGAYGARGPSRPGSMLNVTGSQELRNVVLELTPTGVISGYVTNDAGERAPNTTVHLLKPQFLDGRRTLLPREQVRTNAEGEYQFPALAPGEYIVSSVLTQNGRTYLPIYFPNTTDPDSTASINLLPGIFHSGVDLAAAERESLNIRGKVIGEGGIPPAVFVTLSPRGRRTAVGGSTIPRKVLVTEEGMFEVVAVAPGSYDLIVTLGDGESRSAARTTVDLIDEDVNDLLVTLQPGFEIEGRVTVEGERSLAGATVQLVHDPFIAQVSPSRAPVQPDGTFVLKGVIPGEYRVRVSTTFDAYIRTARLGGADLLNSAAAIGGNDGNVLDVRLSPNVGTVDVSVFDDRQQPADGVQVVLAPSAPNRERLDLYRTGMTDAAGRLHIKGIDPGDYKVFAWDYLEPGSWQSPDYILRYETLGVTVRVGESGREAANIKLIGR